MNVDPNKPMPPLPPTRMDRFERLCWLLALVESFGLGLIAGWRL